MTKLEQLLADLKHDEAVSPTPHFRTNAKIRVINMITVHPVHLPWYQQPRVLGYSVGTALATVVLSVSTVYAAQSSLPNTPLYPIKVASEKAALLLSPTEKIKTTIASSIIGRRISEVEAIQKTGNTKEIDSSIQNLNNEIATFKKQDDISQDVIDATLSKHQGFLNSLKKHNEQEQHNNNPGSDRNTENHDDARTFISASPTQSLEPTISITPPEIKIPQVEGAQIELPPIHREDD